MMSIGGRRTGVAGIGSRGIRAVAIAAAVGLAWAATAAGAGAPVMVGQPFASGPPAVAVDSSGNAIVAWANTKGIIHPTNFVQYCVVPVGATACAHSNELIPADGAQAIDGVQVVADGGTIVILADVFGAQGTNAADYEPLQEWQSTDGGASFSLVDGGLSVASGNINADTGPLNAVIVPGTNVLGFGWQTAGGSPTFNAFPLTSPQECSKALCPPGFATLEPSSNPDRLTNAGGVFAAQAGANPGALMAFNTLFSDGGPFSCPNSTPDGLAFAYGAGNQSSTNSYNISPGSPNSAWRGPATQGECGVKSFTAGGGPSGLGILGDDEGTGTTFYQRFDQANVTFGGQPKVTVSRQGELDPSVGQDGAGGIYATYMNDGTGGPIALSYSYDGGTTWSGPNVLHAYDGQGDVVSAVNGAGQGWVAWLNGGSVFAQSFTATDAVPPPAATTLVTNQTSGAATGPSIQVPGGTIGETDRAAILGANASSAGGTVKYTLYSSPACTAASQVFTSTTAVTGGSAAASAPVTTALAPGSYYWAASYSGNAGNDHGVVGNQPSASTCGSEVLTVGGTTAAVVTPPMLGGGATSNGTTITISVTCTSLPCTVTVTITTSLGQTATAAAKHRPKRGKAKVVTLAGGTFHIRRHGAQKLAVKLTGAGRAFIRSHHGTVRLPATVSRSAGGHKVLAAKRTIRVTIHRPTPHHKKSKK